MLKRCLSVLLVTALSLTFLTLDAGGQTLSEGKGLTEATDKTRAAAATRRRGETFKAGMLKLVGDAKAEANDVAIRPQAQPPHRNNLSGKQKVAIGVGIAVTVLVVAIIVARKANLEGAFPVFGR